MENLERETEQGTLLVREMTRTDIPQIIELNRKAYPELVKHNVIWKEGHLLSHLRVFPEGQIVAELDGKIVGAASSLMVDMGRDPLRSHTYAGITDGGYFFNHDPEGDTLYGADVYVDPDCRGLGVGSLLYEGRRQICQRLNLRRILAGGRLWNYPEYKDQYTMEEYAERVAAGEIKDLVLSFQLREGFVLRGVLRNYLYDPRSNYAASLIEWLNPDYEEPVEKKGAKVRVACVQYQVRKIETFEDFSDQIEFFTESAADYKSDFVVFPEFFSVQLLSHLDVLSSMEGIRKLESYTPQFIEMMGGMARKFGLHIVAGSHPIAEGNKLYNKSFVFMPNGSYYCQPKIHITPAERKYWGISGGSELYVIPTSKAKIGVLICYDIEFPEAARYLAEKGAEIIFVPYCTDNRQGHLRVKYCAQARAIENQVYVVTAGIVGNLPSVPSMDIHYGQASVFTPSDFEFARDGIQAQADANVETLLITDLDIGDLYRTRQSGSVTPQLDRRKDLFEYIAHIPEDEGEAEPFPLA